METDSKPTCAVVRGGGQYDGKQGLPYFEGVSAETAGSLGLCMHLVTIPAGATARPHLHDAHETAIFVLEGEAEMRFGEGLAEHLIVGAGDFLYIPAGMPHQPFNRSERSCVALLARTDPNEQESVVLLPEPA